MTAPTTQHEETTGISADRIQQLAIKAAAGSPRLERCHAFFSLLAAELAATSPSATATLISLYVDPLDIAEDTRMREQNAAFVLTVSRAAHEDLVGARTAFGARSTEYEKQAERSGSFIRGSLEDVLSAAIPVLEQRTHAAHTQTTPTEQPKFCKDCTHIQHPAEKFPTCTAIEPRVIDLVHGYKDPFCSDARGDKGPCGRTGQLFVSRVADSSTNITHAIGDLI